MIWSTPIASPPVFDTASSHTTDLYYTAAWQLIEEDINNSGMKLAAQYVWSAGGTVYVDATVMRDYDFTDNPTTRFLPSW